MSFADALVFEDGDLRVCFGHSFNGRPHLRIDRRDGNLWISTVLAEGAGLANARDWLVANVLTPSDLIELHNKAREAHCRWLFYPSMDQEKDNLKQKWAEAEAGFVAACERKTA